MYLLGDFIPQSPNPTLPDFGGRWAIANLEGPICVGCEPTKKKVGIRLRNEPMPLRGKWAFVLANNHMMDYGIEGLRQTTQFLRQQAAKFAGAGENYKIAREPMRIEEDGKTISIFSCCEHQFGSVDEFSTAGGVAAKGDWLFDAIPMEKKRGADYVVVSCHCASEFSAFVSPKLQSFYHRLIDIGADVIHGHHSHVPQGWECYKGRPIFYGLGNYLVDIDQWRGSRHYTWSLIASIDFSKDNLRWSVTPCGAEKRTVENYIKAANLGFADKAQMIALWQESCIHIYHEIYEPYLRLAGVSDVRLKTRDRIRKAYLAARDLWSALCGKEHRSDVGLRYGMTFYNYFNCESHREVISTALGVLSGVEPDYRTEETAKALKETLV